MTEPDHERELDKLLELNRAYATIFKAANELRDIAEQYLYDGDTDQPLNAGYDAIMGLADRLDVRAALSSAPNYVQGRHREERV